MPLLGIIGAAVGSIISERMEVSLLKKLFGIFMLFICFYEIHSYYILYIKNKKTHNIIKNLRR